MLFLLPLKGEHKTSSKTTTTTTVPRNIGTIESGWKFHHRGKCRRSCLAESCSCGYHHSGRLSHLRWALQALCTTRDQDWGETFSAAPSACFDLLPRDDPPQMPAQPVSRPWEVRLPPLQHHSVDINLPTTPASHSHTSTQAPAVERTLVVLTLGLIRPPGVASTYCFASPQVTPG